MGAEIDSIVLHAWQCHNARLLWLKCPDQGARTQCLDTLEIQSYSEIFCTGQEMPEDHAETVVKWSILVSETTKKTCSWLSCIATTTEALRVSSDLPESSTNIWNAATETFSEIVSIVRYPSGWFATYSSWPQLKIVHYQSYILASKLMLTIVDTAHSWSDSFYPNVIVSHH